MKDKIVFITGATSGIGRATAIAFAAQGAKVVATGRRQAEGEETVALMAAAGGEGIFVQTDVTDETAVANAIETTINTYGRLDYAVNNAGYGGTPGPMFQIPRAEWDKIIAINLTGVWLCMQYELQRMLPQQSGSIVNVTSVAGVWGTPGASPYSAAKHGVEGLTKTAALEYARANIRVNTVAPAGVRTPMLDQGFGGNEEAIAGFAQMHPLGRIGTPEEIAEAILWLCSDKASFVTGHTLMTDAGVTAGVNPLGLGEE